ncbi:MAG: small multi-drug export protein [Dehalococcoidia bacterium]|nr:small multi-drug export protein [Dehalococcoidia bacterium]
MDLQGLLHSGLARELVVLIIAALPVVELRGSIPAAINVFNMPWLPAVVLSVVGNMLPVPAGLLLVDFVYWGLRRFRLMDGVFYWLFSYTRRRSHLIEKYHAAGLLLFVAVPLPFTGAWTGCLAAFLLGMKFWTAFLAVFGGVVIAAVVVTTLALLGWVGATIAGVALCGVAVVSIFGKFRGKKMVVTRPAE